MKRADELDERIATLFAPPAGEAPRFQIVDGPGEVLVEEMERAGYARIACRLARGFRAIPWRLTTGDLRPIGSEKNADGAVLVARPDGAFEAHVMECKQTVDSDPELFELALDEDVGSAAQRDLDWMRPDIHLPGWSTRFEHVRVKKDENGHGTVDLRVSRQ